MFTSSELDRFATGLARAVVEGRHGPLVAGLPPAGGPPALLPLDGRHPLEVLWHRQEPGWAAVVVVATGRVAAGAGAAPAGGEPITAALASPGAVVVASATSRRGLDRSLVLDGTGRVVLERAGAEGLVPDAARRVLGRDTPPPGQPVTAWWATEWLTEVIAAAVGGAPLRSLADVVARHPAVDDEELAGSDADVVAFTIERGWDHAHLTGWDGVRRSVAGGLLRDPSCPAALAGWYDAGSFSRYAQASRPSARRLLDGVAPLLPGHTRAAVERVLVAWGLGADPCG